MRETLYRSGSEDNAHGIQTSTVQRSQERVDSSLNPDAVLRTRNNRAFRGGQSLLQMQRIHGNRYVQRLMLLSRQAQGEGEVTPEVEAAIARSRGGGAALDSGTRRQMESAFGADFSSVRVHTGAESHLLNRAVSAVAFTTGTDLFFRDGAYDPGSAAGKQLLAHELTHVVQQAGSPIQGKLVVGPADDVYEQEADRVGQSVMASLNQTESEPSAYEPSAPIQRQCACGGHGAGECPACRARREAMQRYAESQVLQRRTVCPPGVSPEDGTGCTSVPDDDAGTADQSTSTADATTSVMEDPAPAAPTTSVMEDPAPYGPPAPAPDASTPDAGAATNDLAAPSPAAQPDDVPIANLPGTDYDSCVDQTDEDTARLTDTINTACSVKGAAIALAGGVAGGIYGAYNYGKCVEEQNASARAGAKKQKAQCAQKFKH